MGKNKILYLIILLTLVGRHLPAEEEIYFIGENREIVTLTRTPLPLWATPSRTVIIKQSAIQQEGALNLADILSLLPTFQVKHEPDTINFYFRGMKNGMLLMIDGIPIYEIPSPLSYEIPISPVKQVEIIYGPFTSIWGFNAPGGVININTREGQLFSNEKFYCSSYGRCGNSLSMGINKKHVQIIASLDGHYGKEINRLPGKYPLLIKPGGSLSSPGNILSTRTFSITDADDFFGSLFIKGSTPFLSGEILISDSRRNFSISPFSSMPLIKSGHMEKPFSIFILRKQFYTGNNQVTAKFFYKKVNIKSNTPLFRQTSLTPFNGAIVDTENSRSTGIDINAVLPLNKFANLNLGIVESYQIKNSFVNGSGILTGKRYRIFSERERIWTHSIYVQASTIWKNMAMMGGLRIHKQGIYPVVLSPFASIVFRYGNFSSKTMGGVSYSTPEKIDKTLLGISLVKQQVTEIVDCAKRPEKIETISEDILYREGLFSAGISLYYNRYLDRIVNSIENGYFRIFNSTPEQWWGVTVNGEIKLKKGMRFSLDADYTSRKNPEIFPLKIQSNLRLEKGNLSMNLILQDFLSTGKNLNSWLRGEFIGRVKIADKIDQQIIVTNIFNSDYPAYKESLPPPAREIKWIFTYRW